MPDIDVLIIIKVNIHSIGTEQTGDSYNCCANRPTAQGEKMQSRKQTWLIIAIQTQTAFKI